MSVEALEALAKRPGVRSISIDAPIEAKAVSASHLRVTSGAAAAMQAYGARGTGIGIAIIDSGIANIPDLNNLAKPDIVGPGTSLVGPKSPGSKLVTVPVAEYRSQVHENEWNQHGRAGRGRSRRIDSAKESRVEA